MQLIDGVIVEGSDPITQGTNGKGGELTWDLAPKMDSEGIKGHTHTYG